MEAIKEMKRGEDSIHTTESSTPADLKVTMESLERLTGFPKEFIKSELSLNHDELSLEQLRKSVLCFLDQTLGDVSKLS